MILLGMHKTIFLNNNSITFIICRPSLDTPDRSFNDNLPAEPPKSTTTYEELRRQNRADYDKKMQNPYYRPVNDDVQPVIRQQQPATSQPYEPAGPKNKYGDTWMK